MKAKLLSRVNALIAFVLGLFGFGCVSCVKYGVPHADFDLSGNISNQESQPVSNIQVRLKDARSLAPVGEVYSDAEGMYHLAANDLFTMNEVDILVTDTAGIYASDSVRVTVVYSKEGVNKNDRWDEGKATIHHDFQLKKQ